MPYYHIFSKYSRVIPTEVNFILLIWLVQLTNQSWLVLTILI